jgi:hypothetical protein
MKTHFILMKRHSFISPVGCPTIEFLLREKERLKDIVSLHLKIKCMNKKILTKGQMTRLKT